MAPPRTASDGTAIAIRGGTPVPSKRASGAARQAAELVAPGAHTANVHPSGGVVSGDVTSQVTFAVSPGMGEARSGAPWTSIRAPTTRVLVMRDAGSNVGPHPATKQQAAESEHKRVLDGVGHGRFRWLGLIAVAFQSSPRMPKLGMSGKPETTPTWL